MQQIYIESYFKPGYRRLMKYISNIYHLSSSEQDVIRRRIKIIEFFNEFGLSATIKAFNISRPTIYVWKKKLKNDRFRLSSLSPLSRRPKTFRQSKISKDIKDFIKQYRTDHPGISKEIIKPILDIYCQKHSLTTISESSIGRIVKELKDKSQLPKTIKLSYYARTGKLIERASNHHRKKLRRKGYQPKDPGDLVQIDAIEIFLNGLRRYIITAIDVKSKFAFAYSFKTLSSMSAKDFMLKFQDVAPFEIKHVQTDNGKEFHRYFRDYLEDQNIIHFYNYPRSPKQNCFIENFNGIIQRQYINHHYYQLKDTIIFNKGLMEYLLWYNTEKPHTSIGLICPMRYCINWTTNILQLNQQKSNMLWTGAQG